VKGYVDKALEEEEAEKAAAEAAEAAGGAIDAEVVGETGGCLGARPCGAQSHEEAPRFDFLPLSDFQGA